MKNKNEIGICKASIIIIIGMSRMSSIHIVIRIIQCMSVSLVFSGVCHLLRLATRIRMFLIRIELKGTYE